ncbi:MAG: hypothetical protein JNJ99_11320 [Crocinitomicaceae bacterium]|nr:hypothetical protein [Crocinitomicaceae bacterium]
MRTKTKRVLTFFIVVLNCTGCYFAGEYSSICEIAYNNSDLEPKEIIDSLKKVNPEFGQLKQTEFTYDLSGTGYEQENLFIDFEKERYVIGIQFSSTLTNHKLRIVNFGVEGEVLKKFDSMSKSETKVLNKIVNDVLVNELKNCFPNITFTPDCGG